MIITILKIIQVILILTAILLLLSIYKKSENIKREVLLLIMNIIVAIIVWLI